jgi:two-component system response regulator LytT
MEPQPKKKDLIFNEYALELPRTNGINYSINSIFSENTTTVFKKVDEFKKFFQQDVQPFLNDLLTKLAALSQGKTRFLVVKHNKYFTVPTEDIAYFYIKSETSTIVCFDRQEYFVNYSLEHIQQLLPEKQFFRLNRQCLLNFNAVKEVEHYFARKLLVNLKVAVPHKLLVPKEKVRCFLQWLDNR